MTYRKTDPTRTLTLRTAFARGFNTRFRELRGEIREFMQVNISDARQLENFERMLEALIVRIIMDNRWTDRYVSQSYLSGVNRAISELKKIGVDMVADGISWMPDYTNAVKVMQDHVVRELEGITADMKRKIMRTVKDTNSISEVNGIISGKTDQNLGQSTNTRAKLLAHDGVVSSYNESALLVYGILGIKEVGVEVELLTAGDERVCPLCTYLEGSVFSIEEAEGLLPVHPGCRCFLLPINIKA